MFFRQILAKEATLSYFFGCGSCHVGVVVDPVLGDEDLFMAEAARQDVKITHVIDTHVHADHYSGGRTLAEKTGALYCLHEANAGHTPDSLCLLVTDKRRMGEAAPEPWFVLTGDTLFIGAVGRPDLAGKEAEMAEQIHASIHQRLLSLPAEVEIYPGHTSGSACGAGMSGKPGSTIGFERRWNPMLSMPKEAFVAALTRDIPPRPMEMDRMVQANLGR